MNKVHSWAAINRTLFLFILHSSVDLQWTTVDACFLTNISLSCKPGDEIALPLHYFSQGLSWPDVLYSWRNHWVPRWTAGADPLVSTFVFMSLALAGMTKSSSTPIAAEAV